MSIRPRDVIAGLVVGGSILFLGFITAYMLVVFLGNKEQILEKAMSEHFLAMTGIPLSALSATVIVALFRIAGGNIEFEGLGFKFKGASGPAIMWIIAFLACVGGLKLLW